MNKYFKIGMFLLGLILILRLLKNKKKPLMDENGNRIDWNLEQVQKALQTVATRYGTAFAKKLEQLFRVETAHFTSGQWKKTLSPGMEVAKGLQNSKTAFPYGWTSLAEFIRKNPRYKAEHFYMVTLTENKTGLQKTFIGFPDVETSVLFVAWFIKFKRNGRFGHWYSRTEASALAYESTLETIKTKYT